jgi:glutamate synthase domain-containing protein 2
VFESAMFKETVEECNGQIKMIEKKLSQGAKPGHGGLLPKARITKEITEVKKLSFPLKSACHSLACHSLFSTLHDLVEFIFSVHDLSGGLPVGIKLCIGQPGKFAALCKAIHDMGSGPNFITIDGAEGGLGYGSCSTGAN